MHSQLVSGSHRLQNPWLKSVLKNGLTLLLHQTITFWWHTSLHQKWQAMACRPNLSPYSVRDKNDLHIFKWLGKIKSICWRLRLPASTQRSRSPAVLPTCVLPARWLSAPARQSWEAVRAHVATEPHTFLIWCFREKVGWPSTLQY